MPEAQPSTESNRLDSFWMPFSANRNFKQSPKLLTEGQGLFYTLDDGSKVLDAISGLWCSSLGHGNKEIAQAVYEQIGKLDYSPSYQITHELPFKLSERLLNYLPDSFGQTFFVNSGSEAAETAMKMALAYQQLRGKKNKVRLIGREMGYHGAGFGAISVGGIPNNTRYCPNLLQHTDKLPAALSDLKFNKGEPPEDHRQADALLGLIDKYSADNIAAVIVEPLCCSGGVLVPPAGYLKRLRSICDQHDILLIVDEVITAMGRLGHPFSSQERFGIVPDIIITAKSLANGVIPMGAVFSQRKIYDTLTANSETLVDFFHGYTFSANPAACAALGAVLDIYERDGLFYRVQELEGYWQEAIHSLKGLPFVDDIRNLGLTGAIQITPDPAAVAGTRTLRLFRACLEAGVMTRANGEVLALCPPLIIEKEGIDRIISVLAEQLQKLC
ncbi:aspartate aminotransferase family protein [Endozoicomonas sp. OPT23]|uniref:aminotransferase class III-fold pyridoxal phosphate-dependent enzyme n=1 Tax=Endozoicomonas sp. OPT23 TaxID=2072845 RepID=UPI00129A3BE4|nr:aminotransferase class III-fold pyridoxal phosphate-dependent enzyme [Endozoicomonas sp. OPT23]MRI33570.1 aspartate aminotransferase family protein [Endozoicomonas sp. OPT23]